MGYNIIFIISDDLNDWIGCYKGHPNTKTPNIDAFAETAVRFNCAYTSASLCNPARTAMLIGKAPWNTGIYDNSIWFRDVEKFKDIITLPQVFKNNNYITISSGKVFHKDNSISDPISWSKFNPNSSGGGFPNQKDKLKHGLSHLLKGHFKTELDFHPSIETDDRRTPDFINAKWIIRTIRGIKKNNYFAAYGSFMPHIPWYVPQKYFDMHPIESIQLPPIKKNKNFKCGTRIVYKTLVKNGQFEKAIQGYLASVSYADACIGQILNNISDINNTIVILTSDHGYHLGEQATFAKWKPWQRCNRIPLLIRVPGIKSDVCNEPVSSLDIYPTLMELCGMKPPHDLDGLSIVNSLHNPSTDYGRTVFMTRPSNDHTYVVGRNKKYYYIKYTNNRRELYDMDMDSNQLHNLVNKQEFASIIQEFDSIIPQHKINYKCIE